MIILGSYFSIVSYLDSIENAEHSQFQRLEGIVNTFKSQLDDKLLIPKSPESPFDALLFNETLRNDLSYSLYKISNSTNLNNGLCMLIIDKESGYSEIIDQHGPKNASHASKQVKNLISQQPDHKTKSGLDAEKYTNSIFFAEPFEFGYGHRILVYLYVHEYIGDEIAGAKNKFYEQISIAAIALLILALIGHKSLKQILKHEILKEREINEYVRLAEARNDEVIQLSTVLKKSDNLILLATRDGTIVWLNESYQEKNNYSGVELESFVGKELAEVSHYPKIQNVIDEAVKTKEKVVYEAKSYDKDGAEFWASTTVTPILDEYNEVQKLLFIDADITMLKRAQKEIATLANFTQEHTRPLIRIQSDGKVLFANEISESLLHQWNTKVNGVITKNSVRLALKEAMETGKERFINLECNNRIYNLRFFPVIEKNYANVYGEDITENQIAEKEKRAKAFELEQHNLNITDSINYARKIQEAILPDEDHIRQFFKDSFVLNKPKDIVSGDFFWIHELVPQREFFIALADCTGHGVPGAMMSIIGHSLLNEIVEHENLKDPAHILELLNQEIIKSLRQKTLDKSTDGMDVSIIYVNIPKQEITFAGAYQQLYYINGKLNVFKGDRQPIGGLHHNTNRKFTNHTFSINKGDSIYLSSDGFKDQFGGPENKKFLSRRLQELLISSHKYSMQAQSYIYDEAFEEWRGRHEQIDDVSLIGIKF